MNKYLCIACVILAVACASLWGVNSNLRQEKERLTGNQEALMEEVQYYQDEAGRNAASVQRLELSKAELEAYNGELTQRIEDLNIKLKHVQAATTTATQTNVKIKTIIKDTIIYIDTGMLVLPAIKWQDPWVKVDGIIMPDSSTVDLSIQSVDTLYQVVHRVPKKFWFVRYGTKAIRQEITSSNPHTKIVYSEYIELKGQKKK